MKLDGFKKFERKIRGETSDLCETESLRAWFYSRAEESLNQYGISRDYLEERWEDLGPLVERVLRAEGICSLGLHEYPPGYINICVIASSLSESFRDTYGKPEEKLPVETGEPSSRPQSSGFYESPYWAQLWTERWAERYSRSSTVNTRPRSQPIFDQWVHEPSGYRVNEQPRRLVRTSSD